MTDRPEASGGRRFYKTASAASAEEGGFAVTLDGRTPRTPAGARLVMPTLALARLVAGEWEAQGEQIVMADMPATRLANTAIDAVARKTIETAAEVARYAGSDLLCYRTEAPAALAELEAADWDPLLDWADRALGVRLTPVAGVIHKAQDAAALARMDALAAALEPFALAGLAHAAALLGSAVLAMALQRGRLGGAAAFALSRVDEAFQERRWGVDEEAAARAARMRAEALMLERWFAAL